ncbi:hypothetical protein [Streptomyces sp. Isolate_219]|uniref:hypothetical protein n=1 Tax=Streptomyces sp. Isolate_219 TaxID=2950110 RepID=UPI0021C5953A|nr:hypothetical protein [Streptomyces sp. Isolate_219]MCR8576430.1 hypothetical protein [Streptomyces sp. Isolate_219]
MSDERRERYAGSIAGYMGHVGEIDGPIPQCYRHTADAAMAVADEELVHAVRAGSVVQAEQITRLREENASLRSALEREKAWRTDMQRSARGQHQRAENYAATIERVRAAARKAKDSGNVWDLEDLISSALDGTS